MSHTHTAGNDYNLETMIPPELTITTTTSHTSHTTDDHRFGDNDPTPGVTHTADDTIFCFLS